MPENAEPRPEVTDLDQAIKELIKSYPVDTLEFLLPDVINEWGEPSKWECFDTNTRKHDLSEKGFVMDVNIRYTFPERTLLLVVLIEHWATAKSVDLHRTAHYYLDLMERFPTDEVLPVALVTDLKPAKVRSSLTSASRGRTWLHFETMVREVSREESSAWRDVGNVIAAALRGAMSGQESRMNKVFEGARLVEATTSQAEMRRLFPLIAEVGKLSMNDIEEYMKNNDTRVHSEFVDWFEAKGAKAKGLQDARKLVEHGIPWDVITDSTGIRPEDLEQPEQK